MAKIYYVVEANDGVQASVELNTLKEARKELKSIIKEDAEMGLEKGDISYQIIKYTKTDDSIYWEEVK